METSVTLTVNDTSIEMEEFIASFIERTVTGMVTSLKGIGEIKHLSLIFVGDTINLQVNGAQISATEFVARIFRSTVFGMVAPLKGVGDNIESMMIKIER